MSSTLTEISANFAMDNPELGVDFAASLPANVVFGNRYATLVFPEYADVYRHAISLIMAGAVIRSCGNIPVPTPDGRPKTVWSTVFAFTHVPVMFRDQQTALIIPTLSEELLPLFDGTEYQALHRYHAHLLANTNRSLELLGSDYRFAPLDPSVA